VRLLAIWRQMCAAEDTAVLAAVRGDTKGDIMCIALQAGAIRRREGCTPPRLWQFGSHAPLTYGNRGWRRLVAGGFVNCVSTMHRLVTVVGLH
jgi:hypothetical protein